VNCRRSQFAGGRCGERLAEARRLAGARLPVLRASTTPQLWILGGDDLDAPSPETSRRIKSLIAESKNFTLAVYPGAEHGMTLYELDAKGERLSTRYAPGYFQMMADFVRSGRIGSHYGGAEITRPIKRWRTRALGLQAVGRGPCVHEDATICSFTNEGNKGVPAVHMLISGIEFGELGWEKELAPQVGLEPTTLRLTAVGAVPPPAATGCYKLLSFVHFSLYLRGCNCYPYRPNYDRF
jgi:hypothetical protein